MIPEQTAEQIKKALDALDGRSITVGDARLAPSQCYRYSLDPLHLLFNTNCPDDLRHEVNAVFARYLLPGVQETYEVDYEAPNLPPAVRELQPAVYYNGLQWIALYGEDPETGLTGTGETPLEALLHFEKRYAELKENSAG